MSEHLKLINLCIEFSGIFFCLIALIVVLIGSRLEQTSRRFFIVIFSCIALNLLANIVGLLTRGVVTPLCTVLVRIANFCEYFFGYLLALILAMYLLSVVRGELKQSLGRHEKLLYAIPLIIFATETILLIVTQFTGLFYTIDQGNVYHRGSVFWLSQVIAVTSLIYNLAIIVAYSKRFTKKEISAFLVYNILPALAMIGQLFFYGLFLLLFATTIAGIALFLFMFSNQTDKYLLRQKENSDMQIAIMMSQIQPHFLYNSLTAIAQLCDHDAKQAKKALIAFADYMRVSTNSAKKHTPVPFESELEHVKIYIMLEQLRFSDALKVIYDIGTTDLYLPALSLQPLVENAVKHGVGMKEGGGTIVISTKIVASGIDIEVSDDGVGFDTQIPIDGGVHIGLDNVKRRIEMMCKGRLEIISAPDKGTRAIIHIPEEDNKI